MYKYMRDVLFIRKPDIDEDEEENKIVEEEKVPEVLVFATKK